MFWIEYGVLLNYTENRRRESEVLNEFGMLSRRMKGEDLQGLNLQDLLQLEKLLETGLGRVIETKVPTYSIISTHTSSFSSCFGLNTLYI